MKEIKETKVESKKPKAKKNISLFDWAFFGIAIITLSTLSIWAFVLTARLANATIIVQGFMVVAGVLVVTYSVNSIVKLVR